MQTRILRSFPNTSTFLKSVRPRYNSSVSPNSTRQCLIQKGFILWPEYFSAVEQKILLAASLHKLDKTESRQMRKKRKDYWHLNALALSNNVANTPTGQCQLNDMFAPDSLYEFQEGHYDGVIHHFREMHLSNWPTEEFHGLDNVLKRLYSLCPTKDVQTHLLHLASYGNILPHVDNVGASGSWILGVSLGDERILRLKKVGDERDDLSISLPSGSVYVQRDEVRYKYLHSIERTSADSQQTQQRLSIMIREQNRENIASLGND